MTEPKQGMGAKELALVQSILATWLPMHEVRMFGSRAHGTPKPYSDLDLVIMGNSPVPMATLGQLREALADSDLPWRVDLVDWATTSAEFRAHIADHSIPLQTPKAL